MEVCNFGVLPCYPFALRAPLFHQKCALPMLVKDGWLSLGRKKLKRPATARFTGLYDG